MPKSQSVNQLTDQQSVNQLTDLTLEELQALSIHGFTPALACSDLTHLGAHVHQSERLTGSINLVATCAVIPMINQQRGYRLYIQETSCFISPGMGADKPNTVVRQLVRRQQRLRQQRYNSSHDSMTTTANTTPTTNTTAKL